MPVSAVTFQTSTAGFTFPSSFKDRLQLEPRTLLLWRQEEEGDEEGGVEVEGGDPVQVPHLLRRPDSLRNLLNHLVETEKENNVKVFSKLQISLSLSLSLHG